jgi:hypothetical protein
LQPSVVVVVEATAMGVAACRFFSQKRFRHQSCLLLTQHWRVALTLSMAAVAAAAAAAATALAMVGICSGQTLRWWKCL